MLMAGMFNTNRPKKGERYTPLDSFFLMDNPKQYYTPEFQKIMREKIARIQCPILIVQGDVDRRVVPVNRFNADVLIPELRAAGKTLTVGIYPEQMHCFCLGSSIQPDGSAPPPASWPSAALDAFRDIDSFAAAISRRSLKRSTQLL